MGLFMFNPTLERLQKLSESNELKVIYDLYSEHKRRSFSDKDWREDRSKILSSLNILIEQGSPMALDLLWEIRDLDDLPHFDYCMSFSDLENKWSKNNKFIITLESSPAYIMPKYLKATIYESRHSFGSISFYNESEKFLNTIKDGLILVSESKILSLKGFIDFIKRQDFIEGFDFSYTGSVSYDILDFILYLPIMNSSYLGLNPCSKKPLYRKPMLRSQQLCGLKIGPNDTDSLSFFGMSFDHSISQECLTQILRYSYKISHTEILCIIGDTIKPNWFTFTFQKTLGKKEYYISFTYAKSDEKIIIEVTEAKHYGEKVDYIVHLPIDENKRRFGTLFKNILIKIRQRGLDFEADNFVNTGWLYDLIKTWKKSVFYKERNRKRSEKDPLEFLKSFI